MANIIAYQNSIYKDAKGYDNFYTEYLGVGCDWDGKSDLGLI